MPDRSKITPSKRQNENFYFSFDDFSNMFKVSIQLTNGIEYLTKSTRKNMENFNPTHWLENVFKHPCYLESTFKYIFSLKAHFSHFHQGKITFLSIRMQFEFFTNRNSHKSLRFIKKNLNFLF